MPAPDCSASVRPFPAVPTNSADLDEWLASVFDYADNEAVCAMEWYLDDRRYERGFAPASPPCSLTDPRIMRPGDVDCALKAVTLVLQAGGFAVVALDLADLPRQTPAQSPFTSWLRVQRIIEGSDTACVLVVPEREARSAGGLALPITGRAALTGDAGRSRRLAELDLRVQVVSPRRRVDADVTIEAGMADLRRGSESTDGWRDPCGRGEPARHPARRGARTLAAVRRVRAARDRPRSERAGAAVR